MRGIEPWYGAYAILGALASGFAALLIPIIIHKEGGSGTHIGAAVAAQNIGVFSAPLWGVLADRTRSEPHPRVEQEPYLQRALFASGNELPGG